MRNAYRVFVIVLALAATGCQSLRINPEDSRRRKVAKVAGRAIQGWGTGWLSEAYYAGQRAGR